MLNLVTYRDGLRRPCRVVYLIVGNKCVFSGITAIKEGGSTVNFAQAIISAIAQKEQFRISEIIFCDLQTSRGYNYDVGNYQLNQLTVTYVDGRVNVSGWEQISCPTHVLDEFSEYIGPNPVECDSFGLPTTANEETYELIDLDLD